MGPRDRYELLSCLGSGQFGEVWSAWDRTTRGSVAIKRIRPSQQQPQGEVEWRLKREFRLLADFKHPNLVRMFELRQHGDEIWLVMEQVTGVPLHRYVREDLAPGRPLEPAVHERLRKVHRTLVSAVRELHQAGVLHRDLKPSNVLVEAGGRVVVLDFGLSLLSSETTEAGVMTGSPPYMAPELAFGSAASESADWYSVGIMLFECWWGSPPFLGSFQEQLDAKYEQFEAACQKMRESAPDDLASEFAQLCDPQVDRRRVTGRSETFSMAGSDVPFVGRLDELAAVRGVLDAPPRSGAFVISVTGPSGIGKTRFLEHLLSQLREAAGSASPSKLIVLRARCHPLDGSSFNAFEEVFEGLARWAFQEKDATLDLSLLARDIAPLFGAFFPLVPDAEDERPAADVDARRRRAFDSCRELLRAVSERHRLYCWIDDAQWADRDSTMLLSALSSFPDMPAWGLFLTSRSAERNPLLSALEEGVSPGAIHQFELPPLPESVSFDLARAVLPRVPESALKQQIEQARGSPFLITHFLEEMVRQGPSSEQGGDEPTPDLDRVVGRRVQGLDELPRLLLQSVALSSAPLTVGVASQLVLDPNGAQLALHQLRVEGWLAWGGSAAGGFNLYHERLRRGVLSGVDEHRSAELHRGLAAALDFGGSKDHAAIYAHYLACGLRAKALQHARIAADQAWERLAFAKAAEHFSQILELSPKEPLVTRLRRAHALELAGLGQESGQAYHDAAHELLVQGDEAQAQELRRRAADQWLRVGKVKEGVAELEEVLSHLGLRYPRTRTEAWMLLLRDRAAFSLRGQRRPQPDPKLEPVLRACHTAMVGLNGADILRSSVFQARYARLALLGGTPRHESRALASELAYLSCRSGKAALGKQQRLVQRIVEAQGARPDPSDLAWKMLCEGAAHYFNGDFEHVTSPLKEAEELLEKEPQASPWESTTCRMYRCWSWAHVGRFQELRKEAPTLVEAARARADILGEVAIAAGPSNIAWLCAGDAQQARRIVERALRKFPKEPFLSAHYTSAFALSQIDLYEQKPADALTRITGLWPQLRSSLLLQMQYFRIEATWLRGRAALAASMSETGKTQVYRADAARQARALRKEAAPWARALGELLEDLLRDGSRSLTQSYERTERRLRELQLGALAEALLVAAGQQGVWGSAVTHPRRLAFALLPIDP